MSNSMSLDLRHKQSQSLKQTQRLIMSPQMQQAIHLLQMPILELATIVEAELEQNPVLEYSQEDELLDQDSLLPEMEEGAEEKEISSEKELIFQENDFGILRQLDEDFRDYFGESGNYYIRRNVEEEKRKDFLENSISAETTLSENLMQQAKETFEKPEELAIAEVLIGNLDERGFLAIPLREIALMNGFEFELLEGVLRQIQRFEPIGIGASCLKESLLTQLRMQEKDGSLSYAIIDKHYEDLINNRIPAIKKGLKCSVKAITEAIEHIGKLDFHPGSWHSSRLIQTITPDVTLQLDGDQLNVVVNEETLPALRLNSRYLRMLEDESLAPETKEFIRRKILSAKWLLRNIFQRSDTLQKIVESLAKRHRDFFLQADGRLTPLIMKSLAEELEVHESTIARAVANKYLECPRGILPLRYFFSNAYVTAEGQDMSSKTVRDLLFEIIDAEDKQKPLSDEALSAKLKDKGIPCARRTVAKYRTEMHLGNAQQRKKF